ncbi:similar to Saccharomyces cerevisiae YPL128C TBF1 Telobox-containing general regulatory factor [Maudiozyma saulgeensis]|uniref:Similar to Saccharomyces cerevisiae YPL128C TBF1 Telobox-containing general regulatory factor n=1 Tax=Maudiozyma saulgeensis TaxID=1789683 RepID=A0A1X7R907_9SACH|nr:similar to Saccharomyces cerevisiae YPL128C TBF1 Telobox-containing general regulatory factor [Kazachstania saulgeensis]
MSAVETEIDSENLNRFNGIVQNLPIRTKLTISSLCLLDNISTQLLRFLIFNSNSPQVIALYTEHGTYLSSGETEIFQTLFKLFRQVRLIYNTRSPLLQVHDVAPGLWFPNSPPPSLLKGHEAYIITAIRKANLLTFILTTLGCFSYGFELLQSSFLDIFCPNTMFTGTDSTDQIGKFLKSQAILYLDLKTQAFIAGLRDCKGDSNDIPDDKKLELLQEIFPNNLANQLISRRTGSNEINENDTMTPSEEDFIERCERRKENLSKFTKFDDLMESHDWNHFIKEILDYCNRNMGLIIWGRKGRGKSPLYAFDKNEFDNQVLYSSGAVAPDGNEGDGDNSNTQNNNDEMSLHLDEEITSGPSRSTTDFASSMASFSSTTQNINDNVKKMTQNLVNAAIAASATSGIKKLKPKRTWSQRENDALKEGLLDVGPSWSKILDLHGPGGKISEDLKNRTQVQLKDKARNWKLHYLKSGKPLPDYLTKVTGNLSKVPRTKKIKTTKPSDSTSKPQPSTSSASTDGDTAVAPPEDSETNDVGVSLDTQLTQGDDDDNNNEDSETQKASQANGLFGSGNDDTESFDPNLESSM